MSFTPRLTKPEAGNKYYITKSAGGWSDAVKGSPTDAACNVLSNCVGYAYGRFNEIAGEGSCKYLKPVNAENFIQYAGNLEIGQDPRLGACMVWQKGPTLKSKDGAGHVAIVEKVVSDTEIVTSESGWKASKPFWTKIRKKGNGNWGAGKGYKFIGFIYNPAVGSQEKVSTSDKKALDVAKSFNRSLSGAYAVTANSGLHIRAGAGIGEKSLCVLPKGTKVRNYGYYTLAGRTKWLYIQAVCNGTKYTGFSSATWLKKVKN